MAQKRRRFAMIRSLAGVAIAMLLFASCSLFHFPAPFVGTWQRTRLIIVDNYRFSSDQSLLLWDTDSNGNTFFTNSGTYSFSSTDLTMNWTNGSQNRYVWSMDGNTLTLKSTDETIVLERID